MAVQAAGALLAGCSGQNEEPSLPYEQELARIRAEGLPTDHDELTAWYDAQGPPPEKDATEAYLAAFDAFGTKPAPQTTVPDYQKAAWGQRRWSDEETEGLRSELETNAAFFEKLDAALQSGMAHFPLLRPGSEDESADVWTDSRAATTLLARRAVWRARQGDAAGALADVRRQLRLAESVRQPLQIAGLVRIAHSMTAKQTFGWTLRLAAPDTEDLLALQESAAAAEDVDEAAVVQGERAYFIGAWLRESEESAELTPRALTKALKHFRAWIQACEHPYPERLRRTAAISAVAGGGAGFSPDDPFSIFAMAEGIAQATARGSLNLRFIQMACAVERYMRDHDGRPPESRHMLPFTHVDEILIDPFSGESLQYEHDDAGYRIYSEAVDAPNIKGTEEAGWYEFTAPLPHLRGVQEGT